MTKRFIYIAIGILMCTTIANAKQLSSQEALERVSSSRMKKANALSHSALKLKKTVKAQSGMAALYIFTSADESVVLSGSDSTLPVLGYTDGVVDADNLPDGLEYWLRYMAEEVSANDAAGVRMLSVPSVGTPVAPLLTTRWGQTGAYNKFTPVVNDKQSPSGCVATALAQIMNYHKWPLQPVGSATCSDSNDVEYSMDFDGITFEWEKMSQSYAKDDTASEAADAVATLMKVVGYAVNMEYGPSGSGATDKDAMKGMVNNLRYSSDLESARREAFTRGEWEELLYTMLRAGQPIYYTGRDAVWIGSGGHAFVCDGYDGDGYFHFNWGWDGAYNGYFLTSCLVPEGAGTGGYINGYNYSQAVMVNLYPADGIATASYDYVRGLKFDYTAKTNSFTATFERRPASGAPYQVGMAVTPIGREVRESDIRDIKQVSGGASISADINSEFTKDLDTSVEYDVRMMWRKDASDQWRRIIPPIDGLILYYAGDFGGVLSYASDKWTFTSAVTDRDPYDITVNDLTFNGEDYLFLNNNNACRMNFTNNSDDCFHHAMRIYFVDVESGEKPKFLNFTLDMEPSETKELEFTIKALSGIPAGNYYVEFTEANTHEHISMDTSKVYAVYDETSLPVVTDDSFVYQIMPKGFATLLRTISGDMADGDVVIPASVICDGKLVVVRKFAKALNELIDVATVNSLDIRAEIAEIAAREFYGCKQLESLALPESLRTIGASAFYGCNKLKSLVLPSGLESLGTYAFGGCYALENLEIPGSISAIERYTFSGCNVLKELVVPEGVESLGERAFTYSYALKKLTLPSTMKSIDNKAFYSFYDNLSEVHCNAFTPPTLHEGSFNTNNYDKATLYVPAGAYSSYAADPVWGKFGHIEEDENIVTDVKTIEAAASEISVYSVHGQFMGRYSSESFLANSPLPAGLYIIVKGNVTSKMVLR